MLPIYDIMYLRLVLGYNNMSFSIVMDTIQTSFLRIEQIRGYDFNSLIGNIGGYVGMFLGYALLNFPNAIVVFVEAARELQLKARELCMTKKKTNSSCNTSAAKIHIPTLSDQEEKGQRTTNDNSSISYDVQKKI